MEELYEMSRTKFTVIKDFSDPSLVLHTLKEIGTYFREKLQDDSSDKSNGKETERTDSAVSQYDEAYKSATELLHPLAYHLQRKASDVEKIRFGDLLATDPDAVGDLCEGIINPFVKGNAPVKVVPPLHLHCIGHKWGLHQCFKL